MPVTYEPGQEDIAFYVEGRKNGMVWVGIYRLLHDAAGKSYSGDKILGFCLNGEAARGVAFKLTTESFKAEDMKQASQEWRDRQIEDEQ